MIEQAPPPSDDQLSRIVSSMERLPLIPGAIEKIPALAKNLHISATLMKFNERPMARKTTNQKSLKELQKLANLSFDLFEHIDCLHANTRDALNAAGNNQLHLMQTQLISILESARKAFEAFGNTQEITAIKKPKKEVASEITRLSARYYEYLTGKRPTLITRYIGKIDTEIGNYKPAGLFYEFLNELFIAMDIKASAEAQIKAFREQSAKKIGT